MPNVAGGGGGVGTNGVWYNDPWAFTITNSTTTGGNYHQGNTAAWAWTTTTNTTTMGTVWGTWYEQAEPARISEEEQAARARERLLYDFIGHCRTEGRMNLAESEQDTIVAEVMDIPKYKTALVLTDEEAREAKDAYQRAYETELAARRERETTAAAKAEAERKAEVLLVSLLSVDQKREWLEHKRVTQVGPSGRVWRLFPDWSGGLTLMDGEVRRATLCIHPREFVPNCDVMAGLIAAIRANDEEHIIKTAILHGGRWTDEEKAIRLGTPAAIDYDPLAVPNPNAGAAPLGRPAPLAREERDRILGHIVADAAGIPRAFPPRARPVLDPAQVEAV